MPDSAGSQFFIMHKNAPHLDGSYAAFGKIIEGMDVVNKIAETPTDYSDRPLEDQKIATVTVETFGVDYPEPEKMWSETLWTENGLRKRISDAGRIKSAEKGDMFIFY